MNVDETFAAVRAAYNRYPNLFANLKAAKSRDNAAVSWSGYQTFWVNSMPTFKEFIELAEKGQYSFQTADGGLVQLYYRFKRRNLISASLAFLKPFAKDSLQRDDAPPQQEEVDAHDVSIGSEADDTASPDVVVMPIDDEPYEDVDAGLVDRVVSWIRIDFEPDEKIRRGIAHPACHLHMHGFPDWRLAIRGVPTPVQFIDLVVSQVYPETYQSAHLNKSGNYRDPDSMRDAMRNGYPCFDPDLFESAAHIYLPGVTQLIA